jgi:hypothetical protein
MIRISIFMSLRFQKLLKFFPIFSKIKMKNSTLSRLFLAFYLIKKKKNLFQPSDYIYN